MRYIILFIDAIPPPFKSIVRYLTLFGIDRKRLCMKLEVRNKIFEVLKNPMYHL